MIIWATDLHLNYFDDKFITDFGKQISKLYKADSLIISGDISLGNKLESNLKTLSDAVQMPIYYVLGNHDYWHSSFEEIDNLTKELDNNNIICLDNNIIELDNVIISGFTGWYDCKFGEINPNVRMNDWNRISNFKDKDPYILSEKRSNSYLNFKDKIIPSKNQIIVTHFPPFKELIKNKENAIPFYGSEGAGKMLLDIKDNFEKVICLSGHTHNRAAYSIDNIDCYVGEACRGKPNVCGIIYDDLKVNLF